MVLALHTLKHILVPWFFYRKGKHHGNNDVFPDTYSGSTMLPPDYSGSIVILEYNHYTAR